VCSSTVTVEIRLFSNPIVSWSQSIPIKVTAGCPKITSAINVLNSGSVFDIKDSNL
jgi:hypothetical protein